MNRADRLLALRDPSYAATLALRDTFARIQTIKGEAGRTPVPGRDYFTEEDFRRIVAAVVACLAPTVHGKDGRPGTNGLDGKDGRDGIDGKDGRDGKDGKDGKNAVSPKLSTIVAAVVSELRSGNALSWEHIGGAPNITDLAQLIEFLKRGGFRGGGGSSSTVPTIYNDTVSGTIDGMNRVFTVPNTIQSPVFCSLGNSNYQAGVDYTVTAGKQITFVTAPDSSLSGQPFWLAHT